MPDKANWSKAESELYSLRLWIREFRSGRARSRLSKQTLQTLEMLDTSLTALAEAVHAGKTLMFEINIWEQESFTGWPVEFDENGFRTTDE